VVVPRSQYQANQSPEYGLGKALGRLSSGLYILTTHKGNLSSAMLASWLKASFKPLGVSVAVAKDRAIESLLHVAIASSSTFWRQLPRLMKHFLKRFLWGGPFSGSKNLPCNQWLSYPADALSYMECRNYQSYGCGDHWVIYGTVQAGRVSKPDANRSSPSQSW